MSNPPEARLPRLKLNALIAFSLAVVAISWPALSPLLHAKNDPDTHAEATIPQLQKSIPAEMKTHAVPGASLALIRHGKTISLLAFGRKNAKTNDPVTTDTIFEAASLSKPVFAYGVLKLVDQGKLALDVPLTTYLPKPYINRRRAPLIKSPPASSSATAPASPIGATTTVSPSISRPEPASATPAKATSTSKKSSSKSPASRSTTT